MYGALWRVLPGPVWVKLLILLALLAAVLLACITWVFPWAQVYVFPQDVTVTE
jgi:hypothetical protein